MKKNSNISSLFFCEETTKQFQMLSDINAGINTMEAN